MQNTRRWHFVGRPYFDLALYIQQLAVPTIMLWGVGTIYQRQSDDGWAVEPASGSSF